MNGLKSVARPWVIREDEDQEDALPGVPPILLSRMGLPYYSRQFSNVKALVSFLGWKMAQVGSSIN